MREWSWLFPLHMSVAVTTKNSATNWSGWAADSTLRELVGHSIKLPAVPALYAQVVTELDSARGSMDFVARLVGREPAMCAKILQTVNSAALAPAQRITSAYDAVLFLGCERTKAVILLEQTLAPFNEAACANFSVSELWRHSMSVGSLAAKIAAMEKAPPQVADACFTAGLLHDVGKLLLVGNLPERYAAVLQQAARGGVPLQEMEEKVLGVHHADLGALLLSSWSLPQPLVDAVGWHHEPGVSPDASFSLLTAVHVANAIARELQSPSEGSAIDLNYLAKIKLEGRCDQWRKACGCSVKR